MTMFGREGWRMNIWQQSLVFALGQFVGSTACAQEPSVPPPAGIQCYQKVSVDLADVNLLEDQGYQVYRLVELDSGEIVVPILRVLQARPEGQPAERVWLRPLVPVYSGLPVFLPEDRSTRNCILLLRLIEKPGKISADPWKYWKFNPRTVSLNDAKRFVFPKYHLLQNLEDVKGGRDLLKRVEEAEAYYEKIAD